jgi:hypothetical protein
MQKGHLARLYQRPLIDPKKPNKEVFLKIYIEMQYPVKKIVGLQFFYLFGKHLEFHRVYCLILKNLKLMFPGIWKKNIRFSSKTRDSTCKYKALIENNEINVSWRKEEIDIYGS